MSDCSQRLTDSAASPGITAVVGSVGIVVLRHPFKTVALLSVLLGVGVEVVALPEPTVTIVVEISGLYLIVFGLSVCVTEFKLRSGSK